MTFTAGDKFTHDAYGDGEVVFGPFKSTFSDAAYLIRFPSGEHFLASAKYLTPRPSFAVGDTARTRTGTTVTVTYGPYKVDPGAAPFYVVRFPDGTEGSVMESDLSHIPAEPAIGDTVRVVLDNEDNEYDGRVGILEMYDHSDIPYKVRFPDGDYAWVVKIERV